MSLFILASLALNTILFSFILYRAYRDMNTDADALNAFWGVMVFVVINIISAYLILVHFIT